MPIIGQYTISDVANISSLLHERYGRIVRFGGLIGRPDLLFIYDADEIEKVSLSGGTLAVSSWDFPLDQRTTKAPRHYINFWHRTNCQALVGYFDVFFIIFLQCYRSEGPTPFRPSMPSLVKYKSVVRKDFFGELGGVVGV